VLTYLRALFWAVADFQRHGCTSLAASLAFFFLLSLFPLIWLLLYLIGFVVSEDRIGHEFLLQLIEALLPSLGADLVQEIQRVAAEHVVHWIILASFTWFAMLVLFELDYVINVVFESDHKRNPIITTLVCLGLLILMECLILASYAVTQILEVLVAHAPRVAGLNLAMLAAQAFFLSYALPFVLVFTAVTCLYHFIPRQPPRWRHAAAGALVFALLWEGAKHVFATYIRDLTVYGRMYGSLIVVILFLIGVYYTAALLLYGAAVVERLQHWRKA
jgi:membrane protein